MINSTKLEEKLEGYENPQASKYKVLFILEEHDLEGYVKGEVANPKEDKDETKHKKNLVKYKRIIA